MKIDKYWKLRLEKWFRTKLMRMVYPNVPFEIAYTDIADKYEVNFDFRKVLAEFNVDNKHYVIYQSPSEKELIKEI